MGHYIIYFNQQWVGEHTEEWFNSRGPLARAVVEEMKAAGVYVVAGGVDEAIDQAVAIDPTEAEPAITRGIFGGDQYIGGFTVIDVPDLAAAIAWGEKVAIACGWPQQVRAVSF